MFLLFLIFWLGIYLLKLLVVFLTANIISDLSDCACPNAGPSCKHYQIFNLHNTYIQNAQFGNYNSMNISNRPPGECFDVLHISVHFKLVMSSFVFFLMLLQHILFKLRTRHMSLSLNVVLFLC